MDFGTGLVCDIVLLGLLLLLLAVEDDRAACSPEPWLWDLPFGAPELGGRRKAVEEAGAGCAKEE